MPSITCLRMSDVSIICCVTYFQFPIQSAFLPYRLPGSTSNVIFYSLKTVTVVKRNCVENLYTYAYKKCSGDTLYKTITTYKFGL